MCCDLSLGTLLPVMSETSCLDKFPLRGSLIRALHERVLHLPFPQALVHTSFFSCLFVTPFETGVSLIFQVPPFRVSDQVRCCDNYIFFSLLFLPP